MSDLIFKRKNLKAVDFPCCDQINTVTINNTALQKNTREHVERQLSYSYVHSWSKIHNEMIVVKLFDYKERESKTFKGATCIILISVI